MRSPHLALYQIAPYVAGNVVPVDFIFRHNLASNENPFGASPAVHTAIESIVKSHTHNYPDGNATQLRKTIADVFDIPPAHILCGCGSEEFLHLLARTYLTQGDEVLIPRYGFSVYAIAALSVSAIPVFIEREGDNHELTVAAILAAVTPKTRMLYLDHPGNPIGNFLDREALTTLIHNLPTSVMIVLDAAYAEYMDDSSVHNYMAGHEFIDAHPNVVVTRSFSKAYGLAGLRLGWMHASPNVIDAINRIRAPFNTSVVAQAAGVAALLDTTFVAQTVHHTHIWRRKLEDVLINADIEFISSCTNFILAKLPGRAESLYNTLGRSGIIVRPMNMYKLTDYLRISIGTQNAMTSLFEQIKIFSPYNTNFKKV